MHIYLVICTDRSKGSDNFYSNMYSRKAELKKTIREFATYYNEKKIVNDTYYPTCPIDGYMEYPFFLYNNHYIYLSYDGFDLADLQVIGTFNDNIHAIFLGTEEYLGELFRDTNTNYYFTKDISKEYLDQFISENS